MELPFQAFFGIHHQLFEITDVAHLLFFPHLAAAAFSAIARRSAAVRFLARALPPRWAPAADTAFLCSFVIVTIRRLANATAAGFFRFAMRCHYSLPSGC